ncbi:hypothetical protein AMAG_12283 [Allomyces macrogynus ATCC 38327]|uniref:Uncharacterized protein n=1 Tax=Allomyces macrogynus (strain ATCC 38327) TaxID=578462 RepID=A0A0L0SXH8_ALLM3|nr:hypothetical protein AMAG_12283 [Allomyces macrogynus ATCC 38327]|eukprot:KNE67212.1 hypothetical protein AMAG_12283 [Allomyces macrogynus ATCC 38327]
MSSVGGQRYRDPIVRRASSLHQSLSALHHVDPATTANPGVPPAPATPKPALRRPSFPVTSNPVDSTARTMRPTRSTTNLTAAMDTSTRHLNTLDAADPSPSARSTSQRRVVVVAAEDSHPARPQSTTHHAASATPPTKKPGKGRLFKSLDSLTAQRTVAATVAEHRHAPPSPPTRGRTPIRAPAPLPAGASTAAIAKSLGSLAPPQGNLPASSRPPSRPRRASEHAAERAAATTPMWSRTVVQEPGRGFEVVSVHPVKPATPARHAVYDGAPGARRRSKSVDRGRLGVLDERPRELDDDENARIGSVEGASEDARGEVGRLAATPLLGELVSIDSVGSIELGPGDAERVKSPPTYCATSVVPASMDDSVRAHVARPVPSGATMVLSPDHVNLQTVSASNDGARSPPPVTTRMLDDRAFALPPRSMSVPTDANAPTPTPVNAPTPAPGNAPTPISGNAHAPPSASTELSPTASTGGSSDAPSSASVTSPVSPPPAPVSPPPTLADLVTPDTDPDDMDERVVYPATAHQQYIYQQLHGADSNDSEELAAMSKQVDTPPAPAVLVCAYQLRVPVHATLLVQCIRRVVRVHRVLSTTLLRNLRIIDSDIEAHVDPAADPPIHVHTLSAHADWDVACEPVHQLAQQHADVLARRIADPNTVPLTAVESLAPQTVFVHVDSGSTEARLSIVASSAVADERSLDTVAGHVMHTYTWAVAKGFRAKSFASVPVPAILSMSSSKAAQCASWFPSILPRPSTDFLDFAQDAADAVAAAPRTADAAAAFFRAQVLEPRKADVDVPRRAHLEKEMARLEGEKRAKEAQHASIVSRMAVLELDLQQTETARARLEAAERAGPGAKGSAVYRDELGQTIEINEEMRATLLRTVLGSPVLANGATAELPGTESATEADLLRLLLERHGVADSAAAKLTHYTLEAFAELKEVDIVQTHGIVGRERRKVLALIDYVRNRITEAVQAHARVKYDLERATLRLRRDLAAQRALLKQRAADIDKLAHVILQYNNLIHPPLFFSLTPPAALPPRLGDGHTPYPSLADLGHDDPSRAPPPMLAFHMDLPRQHVRSLSRYAREFCAPKRSNTQSPTAPRLVDVDDDDDDDERTAYVVLALYAILVQHITGAGTFVLGLRQSLRHARVHNGCAVGPALAITVPVKLDLRDLATPLHVLVARVAAQARDVAARAPQLAIAEPALYASLAAAVREKHEARELELPESGPAADPAAAADAAAAAAGARPPVLFEWTAPPLARFLAQQGVTAEMILESPAATTGGTETAIRVEKVVAYDTHRTPPDLELRGVDTGDDHVRIRLAARRDVPPRVAERWVAKFQYLLEGVDVAQRSVTIASMISRFYHSAWRNEGTAMELAGAPAMSMRSMSSLDDVSAAGMGPGKPRAATPPPGSIAELRTSIAQWL